MENFVQKRDVEAKTMCISESAEDKLSSHVFISICKFLTKIDIFFERKTSRKYLY